MCASLRSKRAHPLNFPNGHHYLAGGIDIEKVKAKLRKQDKLDREAERARVKAMHKEKRRKERERRKAGAQVRPCRVVHRVRLSVSAAWWSSVVRKSQARRYVRWRMTGLIAGVSLTVLLHSGA